MNENMKEILIANLTLDTTRKNNIPPLVVPQNDYGARVIRARITDLGTPVNVESTAAVSIVATRKGDGESLAFSGTVNSDGSVTVPVTQWMLDLPDEDVTCHVVVTGSGYQYSTTSFLIEPQEKANPTEISKDDPRVDVVTEVLAKENARQAAEATREANEQARKTAEEARQSAETQRLTDEATRVENEAQRVSAELSRDTTFKGWTQDIASLPSFDSRISRNDKRITNLEQGIPAELFETDNSVAYQKDVPENALPYAEISKLGGMTRKCANLLNVPEQYSFTQYARIHDSLPAGTYTISYSGSSFGSLGYGSLRFYTNDVWIALKSEGGTETITLTSDETAVYVYANGMDTAASAGVMATISRIMLNSGTTALPYEPYFEGLRSAAVTEVKSVGVNLFDLSQAKADIGSIEVKNDNIICQLPESNKDFFAIEAAFDVIPNTQYSLSWDTTSMRATYIYTDKILGNKLAVISSGSTFNSGENKKLFFGFYSFANHRIGTSETISNITLNKGSTALPYTPYAKHTLPIPKEVTELEGYGWGVNESVYNYIDYEKKQFVKRVERVDLGTLGFEYNSEYSVFTANLPDLKPNSFNMICDIYSTSKKTSALNVEDMNIYSRYSSGAYTGIGIKNSNYTDAATFKAAMSGVMLYYELETPIITDISDIITSDNLIGVEGNGTITFENEYGYAVPSEVTYQLKGVTA